MTDVLVVGAGPTGLMMACQLARHGVRVRIIDEQVDRVNESRAFGIQARSMEIFDGLGLGAEVMARARRGDPVRGHIHGAAVTLHFDQIVRPDGHVGFRSCGPSLADAAAYLDTLFGLPRWEPDAIREDRRGPEAPRR